MTVYASHENKPDMVNAPFPTSSPSKASLPLQGTKKRRSVSVHQAPLLSMLKV